LEAARVLALLADPLHFLRRGLRRAIHRADRDAVGAVADLAQAVARLAAATVRRVMDRRRVLLQVHLAVVDHATHEQGPDHVAPPRLPGLRLAQAAWAPLQSPVQEVRRAF